MTGVTPPGWSSPSSTFAGSASPVSFGCPAAAAGPRFSVLSSRSGTRAGSLCPHLPPLLPAPQLQLVPQPPSAECSACLSADLPSAALWPGRCLNTTHVRLLQPHQWDGRENQEKKGKPGGLRQKQINRTERESIITTIIITVIEYIKEVVCNAVAH